MLTKESRLLRAMTVVLLVGAGLLVVVSSAMALNSFLKNWQTAYPVSTSDNADCGLCHGPSDNAGGNDGGSGGSGGSGGGSGGGDGGGG